MKPNRSKEATAHMALTKGSPALQGRFAPDASLGRAAPAAQAGLDVEAALTPQQTTPHSTQVPPSEAVRLAALSSRGASEPCVSARYLFAVLLLLARPVRCLRR